jgi:hypothetical protein
MAITERVRVFRLLLIEDDILRVEDFRAWLPSWATLVWAQSAGSALGVIRRDTGRIYGGVLLDHDLEQRVMTVDDESLSGTDVALALVENFSTDVPILIHSMNHLKAPRVARQLEDRGFWVTRIPFYDLSEVRFRAWLEEARDIWEEL